MKLNFKKMVNRMPEKKNEVTFEIDNHLTPSFIAKHNFKAEKK